MFLYTNESKYKEINLKKYKKKDGAESNNPKERGCKMKYKKEIRISLIILAFALFLQFPDYSMFFLSSLQLPSYFLLIFHLYLSLFSSIATFPAQTFMGYFISPWSVSFWGSLLWFILILLCFFFSRRQNTKMPVNNFLVWFYEIY